MQNKKQIILSIIAIVTLAILVIGASFAYFAVQGNTSAQTSATVKTYTVDVFSFETGAPISFSLNQENFASGAGNQTGSTFAKAILTANNKTNTATDHYNLYLNISENTFTYTQNENTPEILLTITDGTNPVTNITSLTYKTVTDGKGNSISGYDITNKTGLIELFSNREITTTSTKTENWNITVTFINYNADQSKNAGNTFSGKVLIQKEEYELTLADICNGKTLSDCVVSQYTGMQGENSIYYHNSSLENGAGDNSYRYAGANPNNFVCFGSDASPCPTDNLYRIIGVFGENYHGANGKQLVKLIKYDYMTTDELGTDGDYSQTYKEWGMDSTYKGTYGDGERIGVYYWNYKATGSATNTWSTSLLNKTNLNTNFINYLGTTWANKIATVTWKVGGNTDANIRNVVPATTYQNEIVNPVTTNTTDNATTYSAKIGLMYVSDYGFAASPDAWTLTMSSYNNTTATNNNWMYMGLYEWTISRTADGSHGAFRVYDGGYVGYYGGVNSYRGVRASFSLESSVSYVSGDGTLSNPIRIN